jgi:hypothetical protein
MLRDCLRDAVVRIAAQTQQAVAAAAAREKATVAALNDANNRVQELQVCLIHVLHL